MPFLLSSHFKAQLLTNWSLPAIGEIKRIVLFDDSAESYPLGSSTTYSSPNTELLLTASWTVSHLRLASSPYLDITVAFKSSMHLMIFNAKVIGYIIGFVAMQPRRL